MDKLLVPSEKNHYHCLVLHNRDNDTYLVNPVTTWWNSLWKLERSCLEYSIYWAVTTCDESFLLLNNSTLNLYGSYSISDVT